MTPQATKLFEGSLDLARQMARIFQAWRARIAGLERDDLEQIAMIALWECAERFEPERGIKFSTYASHRIRGALIDATRDRTVETGRQRTKHLPRDAMVPLHDDDGEPLPLPAPDDVVVEADYRDMAAQLAEKVGRLTRRQAAVVRRTIRGEGPKEISRALGISEMGAHYLRARAYRRLGLVVHPSRETHRAKPWHSRAPRMAACRHCGTTFQPWAHSRGMFCSRQCTGMHRTAQHMRQVLGA